MSLNELGFTVRTYNCLRRAGIDSVEELQQFIKWAGYAGLKKVRGLGSKSLEEIKTALEKME